MDDSYDHKQQASTASADLSNDCSATKGIVEQQQAGTNVRRRRHRNDTSSSLVRDFVSVVKRAVADLMERHGYGHERATALLLNEITLWSHGLEGSGSGSHHSTIRSPSDKQIFETMRRYGLGTQQAIIVLSVSGAIEHYFNGKMLGACDASRSLALEELSLRLSNFATRATTNAPVVRVDLGLSSSSTSTVKKPEVAVESASPAVVEKSISSNVSSRTASASVSAQIKTTNTSVVTQLSSSGRASPSVKAGGTNKTTTSVSKGKSKGSGKPPKVPSNASLTANRTSKQGGGSENTVRSRSDSVTDVVNAKLVQNAVSGATSSGTPKTTPQSTAGNGSAGLNVGSASVMPRKRSRSGIGSNANNDTVNSSSSKRPRQPSA